MASFASPDGAIAALVLAHEPLGDACELARHLERRGVAVTTHLITADLDEPSRAAPFPSIDGIDLIIPMGSVRSLTDRSAISAWIEDELELLADAHRQGIPLLGVCFGGQLLAEALGGSVERAPSAEIGWFEIDDGPDGPNPVGRGPWMQWHHDRFTPPPEAELLAVTERAVQLFRLGSTVGTQFHPEVDLDRVTSWLDVADDTYLDEHDIDRHALVAATDANAAASAAGCGRLVDWYLDEVLASEPVADELPGRALLPPGPQPEPASSPSSATPPTRSRSSDAEFMQ